MYGKFNCMRDSRIKEPNVIYVITQPFCCYVKYTTHDLDQSYVLLSSYSIQQTIKRNEFF